MAVSSTTNRASFSGNGVTTLFPFPYYLAKNTDLKVLAVAADGSITPQVLNTDYTLAFIAAAKYGVYPDGANITMIVAPPAGTFLVLYRDPSPTQTTHWTDNDPMPASSNENTADKAMVLVQRLLDLAARSIKLKDGYVPAFDPSLPEVIDADKILAINSTGDGIVLLDNTMGSGVGTNRVDNEAPAGAINNVNLVFTLAHTPAAGTFKLYINGARRTDYTLVGTTLTLAVAPGFAGEVLCDYFY